MTGMSQATGKVIGNGQIFDIFHYKLRLSKTCNARNTEDTWPSKMF